MKLSRKQQWIVALVVILLIIAGLGIYGVRNRKRVQEEVDELYRLIRKGVGALGKDIKTILDKVSPDNRNPTKLLEAAKSLYKAFWWEDLFGFKHRQLDDDEEAVINILKKLTKGEVKAMIPVFAREYGKELDDFLREYNTSDTLKTYYTTVANLN